MERAAEEREQTVLQFTNIDNEDFTHSFRGLSITVSAGAVYTGINPAVHHLAKHLARKILGRKKKAELAKKPAGAPAQNSHLFETEQVEELVKQMISPIGGAQESKADPDDITKQDVIAELEKLGVQVDASFSKEELLQNLIKVKAKK